MSENNRVLTLNNKINVLKEELAQKIVLKDHVQLHVCPQLDSDYIFKFGDLNYQVYNYQIECEKTKNRISLMEKQLNRQSMINLFDIDEEIDRKFSKEDDYLNEMLAKLTVVKTKAFKKGLRGEEFKKLNNEYKNALIVLHPDLADYYDLTVENFLLKIIDAYEDYDIQKIKSVKFMALNTKHPLPEEKSIEDLEKLIKLLKIRIELINKDLIEIKNSYPFNKKDFLRDIEEVEDYKNKLNEEKENFIEELTHYESIENSILDKANVKY